MEYYAGKINLEDFKKVKQEWAPKRIFADIFMFAGAGAAIYLTVMGGFHIPEYFGGLPTSISAFIFFSALCVLAITCIAGLRLFFSSYNYPHIGEGVAIRRYEMFVGFSLFVLGGGGFCAELILPQQAGMFVGVISLFVFVFFAGLYILGTVFPQSYLRQTPPRYVWIFIGLGLSLVGLTGAFMFFVSALPAFTLAMWAVFYALYWVNMLGITLGYHRLAAHRAFKCGKNFTRFLFGSGATGRQQSVEWWCKEHRIHHERTEIEAQDPHTPRESFIHSWHGWLWRSYIYPKTIWFHKKFSLGLDDNQLVREQKKYWSLLLISGFVIGSLIFLPFGILTGGMWHGLWLGLEAFLLTGTLRLTLTFEVTMSVNSWSHKWGPKYFISRNTGDSTDPWYLAIFSLGENLQNIHHLMDFLACYWVDRWHPDFSGAILVALERLGRFRYLAWAGLPYDLQTLSGNPNRLKFMIEHMRTKGG